MRKYPFRFNRQEIDFYNELVRELQTEEHLFLKDAREKARSIIRGRILTEELEKANAKEE